MEKEKYFINKRYLHDLQGNYDKYVNRNGVFKKIVYSIFIGRTMSDGDIWYLLSDLPPLVQEKVRDMAVRSDELAGPVRSKKNSRDHVVRDSGDVLVYVNDETLLLPVVGNILASDGTHAYTVVRKNGHLILKPIIVCWNCHWSDLFSGQTEYGMNVFCLVSDLTVEQRANFIDEMIQLKNVPAFLGQMDQDTSKNKLI